MIDCLLTVSAMQLVHTIQVKLLTAAPVDNSFQPSHARDCRIICMSLLL